VTAARALASAQAAGVRLRLTPDGTVKVEADAPPPAELLAELRKWRGDIVRLLAAPDPDLAAELAVMREHYAEPSAEPYRPDHPDPLRDGLLAGFRLRPPPPGHDIEERRT
jgi:hypothetical protein